MDIRHQISGLQEPAEIVMDRWGIPHIRARTRHDVFFAQGFTVARERLWQLDIWRKRGLGRLAADFGPGFLAQDRAARLFLYRGNMDAEWAAYGTPEARAITEAFVSGINAWIGLAEADPSLMPPEFAAMGTSPERWEAADVVRIRSHARVRNADSEVKRARVLARAGLATDTLRRSIEPPWDVIVPDGVDWSAIPDGVLDVYELATVDLDLSPARLTATLEDAWRWHKVSELGEVSEEGSNNWVISATRTATGRPILASDPHRAHSLPSLRMIMHLTGPSIDVIGAGEPAVPGISIGHNGFAAFGLTIFPIDQEDLYIYDTHPDDAQMYGYGDGWERMVSLRETVAVKGAAPQEVELAFTRHGPVVFQDYVSHRAYAVRTVWLEAGTSAYFGALAYLGARSVAAFATALECWRSPSVNQIYADCTGDIAWFAAGLSPVRPNWDGLLPVPGDGRYEWSGFTAFEDMPNRINPIRGFVATANEMNLPVDYAYRIHKLGFEWAEHSRTTRIHAVLDTQTAHTIEDSMALQTDDFSRPAHRLGALLAGLSAEGDAGIALGLLQGWNCHLARDSAAAAVQEVWWTRHLKPALLDGATNDAKVRALLAPGDVESLLATVETMDDPAPLLLRTLAAAVAECRTRLGEDVSSWAWGRLHHGYFPHRLARVTTGLRDVGPLPKGGSASTPMAATYRMSDFRLTSGASFRMVVDVGNWDNSRCINAPGQSGNPASPHYDDLSPLWAAGEYVPMLYSAAAVDAAAELRILLTPA